MPQKGFNLCTLKVWEHTVCQTQAIILTAQSAQQNTGKWDRSKQSQKKNKEKKA